jgi:hypothetical protein
MKRLLTSGKGAVHSGRFFEIMGINRTFIIRVVNAFDFFAIFRILLIAQLRKPANAEPGIQSWRS